MQIYDVPVIYTLNMIIILCCWNSFSALAFWLGVIRSVQLLRCWQGYLSGWKFTAWFAYAVADTTAAASFLASLWCTVVFLLHTHTHLFNGPFPGLPRWAGTRKVKPIWILLKQKTVSGSGISWAICKSASCSRQITMPLPHHSSFFIGQMPFLPPNQQCQSTEGSAFFLSVTHTHTHV